MILLLIVLVILLLGYGGYGRSRWGWGYYGDFGGLLILVLVVFLIARLVGWA